MAAVEGEACEARAEAAVSEVESLVEGGSEGVSVEQDFCVESILVCVHVWPSRLDLPYILITAPPRFTCHMLEAHVHVYVCIGTQYWH